MSAVRTLSLKMRRNWKFNLKNEYDVFYEHLSVVAMTSSRATWYEYGEKRNKYFLNLENRRKSKSCIRKV